MTGAVVNPATVATRNVFSPKTRRKFWLGCALIVQGPPYLTRIVGQVVDKFAPLFFCFGHMQGMAPCGIIFAAYTRITLWGRGFCRRFGKFWLTVVGLCRVNGPIGHGASPQFGRRARICRLRAILALRVMFVSGCKTAREIPDPSGRPEDAGVR